MKNYNIVYLHTHDTGRGIQPYDPGIKTPNLMRLAQEGVLFRNAYCVGPTCSPSRSGLLTGQYPHQNGMFGLAHRGFSLNDYGKHLANFLKGYGYETVLFGMQHEAADANTIGYDRVFAEERKSGADRELWDIRNARKAKEFLEEYHDKPFFLSYGMEATHKPYPGIAADINPDYIKVPSCLPDTEETREDYAGFLTSAEQADQILGQLIDVLKESGQYENTILLYTTDHGIALPHMKCTLYDTGIGVAMILSAPGYRKGTVVDALVSQIDWYPTLCQLLEIPYPEWLEGASFKPLLDGEREEVRAAVYAEINYHAARNPQRMVRTKQFKYIRQYYTTYAPCNIDSGEAKEFLIAHGLLDWKTEKEQLYDLYMDPAERKNLAENPEYREKLEEMRALLQAHMEKTADKMETEGLPEVPGMIMNRRECYDADSTDSSDYEKE